MRIALIVPAFDLDHEIGIPAVTTLGRALAERADLTVYAVRYPQGPETVERGGLSFRATGGPELRARTVIRRTVRAIRADHRRKPFDVLHGVWLFEPGLVAVLAGRLLGVPVMVSIGGAEPAAIPEVNYGGMLSRRGRLINRQVMRRAALITGGSRYVLDLAGARMTGDPRECPDTAPISVETDGRFRLAPLPVDTSRFSPAPSGGASENGAPHLLHVGAFLPVKQQEQSVHVLAQVRERLPGARLTMIGEDPHGMRDEIDRFARDLGVGDAVELRDRAPQADLVRLYRSADVHLLPSLHESQGMVALEAAACGVPTVGSAVGVVADLAPDAAIAVPRHDLDGLSDAVIELLVDDQWRRDMGKAARRRVEAFYSVPAATERFLTLYRELAGSR